MFVGFVSQVCEAQHEEHDSEAHLFMTLQLKRGEMGAVVRQSKMMLAQRL
jgi:hypothetical protein